MTTHQPLTLTVEQAGSVLGVGRSTAYELIASGDLPCIRLRRRIVVPVAQIAERLGVTADTVWRSIEQRDPVEDPSRATPPERPMSGTRAAEAMTLF